MSRPGLVRAGSTRAVENKTIVLVSGGNSGVGYEIVNQLAYLRSDFQILLGCRNVHKGEQAAAAMGAPINVNPIHLDINDDQSVDHCAMAIEQHFGRVDVLINNASSTGNDLVEEGHEPSAREIWSHVTRLNVASTAVVTEKMVPLLQHSKAPKIIFVSNELASFDRLQQGKKPVTPSMVPYVVSKSAVNMLAMQLSLQHPQISVNCAAPAEQDETDGSDGSIARTVVELACNTTGATGSFVTAKGQIPW